MRAIAISPPTLPQYANEFNEKRRVTPPGKSERKVYPKAFSLFLSLFTTCHIFGENQGGTKKRSEISLFQFRKSEEFREKMALLKHFHPKPQKILLHGRNFQGMGSDHTGFRKSERIFPLINSRKLPGAARKVAELSASGIGKKIFFE